MEEKELFRKKALEYVSSPRALEDMLKVTSPKSWIILIVFAILFFSLFLWAIFGVVVTRVNGVGILVGENEDIKNLITPEASGYIATMLVKPGMEVSKGQVVARIDSPKLDNEINSLKKYIQKLEKDYENLSELAASSIKTRKKEIDDKRNYYQSTLETIVKKEENYKFLLDKELAAFKRGLITYIEVTRAKGIYLDTLQAKSDTQKELITLDEKLKDYVEEWAARLRALKLIVDENKHKLKLLDGTLGFSKEVHSAVAGIVEQINVKVGDYVTAGKGIITILTAQKGLEVLAYIQVKDGKHVRKDMRAQVYPSTVKKIEYGGMVGNVTYVSGYPQSYDAVLNQLRNKSLVDSFFKQGPLLALRIHLVEEKKNFTQYKWSSSKGPDYYVTPGTLVDASVLTRKQSPLSLFTPLIKRGYYWIEKK